MVHPSVGPWRARLGLVQRAARRWHGADALPDAPRRRRGAVSRRDLRGARRKVDLSEARRFYAGATGLVEERRDGRALPGEVADRGPSAERAAGMRGRRAGPGTDGLRRRQYLLGRRSDLFRHGPRSRLPGNDGVRWQDEDVIARMAGE